MDDPTTTGITEGFGLMFYREASLWDNARWYDPALGRFAQADTIVPGGVQGWDRYAYTANNPLKYIDSTGHWFCNNVDGDSCMNYPTPSSNRNIINDMKPGDILTIESVVDGETVIHNFMLGIIDDSVSPSSLSLSSDIPASAAFGFWDLDTKSYVPYEDVVTTVDLSNKWTIFTRVDDNDFNEYKPSSHNGEIFDTPVLEYYWAGGADSNPSYVEVWTLISRPDYMVYNYLTIQLSPIAAGYSYSNPGFVFASRDSIITVLSTLAANPSWQYFTNGDYIDSRIPIIHP